jgi:hypothetical protein
MGRLSCASVCVRVYSLRCLFGRNPTPRSGEGNGAHQEAAADPRLRRELRRHLRLLAELRGDRRRTSATTSLATVHEHLSNLEQKGFLRKNYNKSRSLEVVRADLHAPAVELPLLGTVAAGLPLEAVQEEETVTVPHDMVRRGNNYVLRVKGDSMIEEQIRDGDYIIVNSRQTAENGEMVVALVEGESATVKKFYASGTAGSACSRRTRRCSRCTSPPRRADPGDRGRRDPQVLRRGRCRPLSAAASAPPPVRGAGSGRWRGCASGRTTAAVRRGRPRERDCDEERAAAGAVRGRAPGEGRPPGGGAGRRDAAADPWAVGPAGGVLEVDRGSRVEHHRRPRRAADLAPQHPQHLAGVVVALAAFQPAPSKRGHPSSSAGSKGSARTPAALHLQHLGGAQRAQLVHPRLAVHHQRPLVPQLQERAGDQLQQRGIAHPHHLPPRAGGVGDGAQHVHHRGHRQLAADGADVAHGRVVERREHEDDAALLQHPRLPLRRQLQPHAQRLQHVRAPAAGGEGAVPVLGHPHPRPRRGAPRRWRC